MNWTCPYCGHAQTVTEPKFDSVSHAFKVNDALPYPYGISATAIGCSNNDCRGVQVSVNLLRARHVPGTGYVINKPLEVIHSVRLAPESSAKPQPAYIPEAVLDDYIEACRIRALSPKASATLSRRCLQGMIRDFCNISDTTLYKEIEQLKALAESDNAPKGVSVDSIDGLHHVRSLGNIGAHMERDIDIIVPVDPDEAQVLIELIETLFDEWYVAGHKREERFAALKRLAEEKQAARSLPKPDQSKD